jgi:hypothetical protein
MTQYRVPVLEHFSWQPPVANIVTAPAGGESKGGRYIVANSGASGVFTGKQKQVATANQNNPTLVGHWLFDLPDHGWIAWNNNDNKYWFYDSDNTWKQLAAGYSGYSGISGASGYSGISGASGYSGISGASGYSGISGASGYSGISGASGYSGISGASGYSGISGASGYSGISGASGYSGISGASGYSGISGASGYSGISGASGYSGFSGPGAVYDPEYECLLISG